MNIINIVLGGFSMKDNYKVAIVGASGLVGRTILKVLEEKNFENVDYVLFSSKKSAGTNIKFLGKNYFFQELNENSFDYNFDFAIFSAGSKICPNCSFQKLYSY